MGDLRLETSLGFAAVACGFVLVAIHPKLGVVVTATLVILRVVFGFWAGEPLI